MTYLFSQEGRQALEALTMRSVLYAFDFDGTLAPISSDRDAVQIPSTIRNLIQALAMRAPCAIVSGRSLGDLTARVNGAVPHLIGNHGLESPFTLATTLLQAQDICRTWMKTVAADSEELLAGGLEIEDKRYSLTFHYRHAGDIAGIRIAVLNLLSRLTPLPRVLFGKLSVNVLPPGQDGKGAAVLALRNHLRQDGVFYIGDEDTDENVFTLKEGLIVGVRVGRHGKSLAGFYVNHQREIEDVLQFLIRQLDERQKP